MTKQTITINGNNFSGLETFYDEIDYVFTKDLNWETGHNLDAFNDLLRGGFGVYEHEEPITLIWKNIAKSKSDLGFETTKRYFEQNIANNKLNAQFWIDKLKELINGNGQTLFEIIIDIISGHEHIELKSEY